VYLGRTARLLQPSAGARRCAAWHPVSDIGNVKPVRSPATRGVRCGVTDPDDNDKVAKTLLRERECIGDRHSAALARQVMVRVAAIACELSGNRERHILVDPNSL
jgi:hypothetical protein